MTDNPILLSPDRLKGKHKIVRWGGGNDNNNNNNNNNNMNSNNKLNHLSSLHKIPTHDIENSSNSGSEVNSDYYYDSDDHDCYGGKSVYDVGSENSDQLNYSQNYGIASVKIANKKAHDEAKLRNATANAARNNNLSDVEDQKHNNNNNTNNNNYSNISHISSGVSTTISPSNVHQKKHNNEMFRSPERNNKNIEITPTQTELPKSMIFEMNKKMNNQMNFIRNNTVNQRIIINKNDGSNNTNNNNTNFTNNNAINSVNISGNNGNNSNNSSISSKSNEINTGNVIEIIPDNGVSLFHGDNKLTNNNNNNINNSNSNNITNMTLNIPTTRIMNSEQKLKLPNIQTSSQNFNDQNDPENAWLSVPLDDEKSPGK